MSLAPYYSNDRSMMRQWQAVKGEAAAGWGDIFGDILQMGTDKWIDSKQTTLDEGYGDYTAGLGENETPMSSDEWESTYGDDYLDTRREEDRQRRADEKAQGERVEGIKGLLQRILPGGESGYAPITPQQVAAAPPVPPGSYGGGTSGMQGGPIVSQPAYTPPASGSTQPVQTHPVNPQVQNILSGGSNTPAPAQGSTVPNPNVHQPVHPNMVQTSAQNPQLLNPQVARVLNNMMQTGQVPSTSTTSSYNPLTGQRYRWGEYKPDGTRVGFLDG